MNILLADDDESDVFFLRQAIKACAPGAFVASVGDGEKVLDYLSGRGRFADRLAYPIPDHLLLDVKMPKLSGFEVLEWLRGRPELASIRLAVLSGSELPVDSARASALGAAYLVKPLEYAQLAKLIRAYLTSEEGAVGRLRTCASRRH